MFNKIIIIIDYKKIIIILIDFSEIKKDKDLMNFIDILKLILVQM